mmetsp:Transcript_6761/g.28374  ORF Transcript_6761/g.28374 Transcript_6761/m.28374 type:complete len:235 (+) Transcript_6761:1334-2038(+)
MAQALAVGLAQVVADDGRHRNHQRQDGDQQRAKRLDVFGNHGCSKKVGDGASLERAARWFGFRPGQKKFGRRRPSAKAGLGRSGFELGADLAGLVGGAVHIHIELASLVGLQLLGAQLGAGGHRPLAVGRLGERHDDGAVLAGGGQVDVGHRAVHALGGDGATDAAVGRDADVGLPGGRGGDGRNLLIPGQLDGGGMGQAGRAGQHDGQQARQEVERFALHGAVSRSLNGRRRV